MAENSENIEAKLCAYVEGDLDETGRAEIERHLEAHPNHRRLLAELMSTRDLLRYLPREQAPPELAETFNAQLERSELLDGPGGDPSSQSMRMNLLPRLLAVAAVVVLGVGLGVVVYFGLPRGESGTQLAMPANATRPFEDGAETFDAASQPFDHLDKSAGSLEDASDGESRARRMAKGGPGAAGEVALGGIQHDPTHFKNYKMGDADIVAQSGDEPVYLIVSATDLSAAVREVTTNLLRNQISWEPAGEASRPSIRQNAAGESEQADAATSTRLYAFEHLSYARMKQQVAGRQQTVGGRQQEALRSQAPEQILSEIDSANLADAGTANPAPAVSSNRAADTTRAEEIAAAPVNPVQGPAAAPAPAPASPAAAPGTEVAAAREDESKNFAGTREITSNAQPPSAVAEQVAVAEQFKALNEPADVGQAATAPAHAQQRVVRDLAADGVTSAGVAGADDVEGILAYRMTRRQVVDLGKALSRENQQVELVADDVELQTANAELQRSYAAPVGLPAAVPPAQPTADVGVDPAFGEATAGSQPPAPASADQAVAPPSHIAAGQAATRPARAALASKSASVPTTRSTIGLKPDRVVAGSVTPLPGAGASYGVNLRSGTGPRPGESVIQRGETLHVTVDELAGPDTDKTAAADVAPDGTVDLPKLAGPLRVEGLTRPQAERVIADAYRSAGVIDTPTVSIEPVGVDLQDASAPTAATPDLQPAPPAPEQVETAIAESTESLPGQAGQTGVSQSPVPATTRAAAQAGSDEEMVDVLILVQRTAIGPAPQTQPAPAGAVDPSTLPADEEAPLPLAPHSPSGPSTNTPSANPESPPVDNAPTEAAPAE